PVNILANHNRLDLSNSNQLLLGPLALLFSFQRSKALANVACEPHLLCYQTFDLLSTIIFFGLKQPAARQLIPAEQRGANIQPLPIHVNKFLIALVVF
ncbi:hypothetical protein, partial [Desulfobulbus propionicus]